MPHSYRCNRGLIDNTLSYQEDAVARAFVQMYPHGATLEIVGEMFGLTRERIRQIESRALRKLRMACESEGMTLADFLRLNGVNLGYSVMRELWLA